MHFLLVSKCFAQTSANLPLFNPTIPFSRYSFLGEFLPSLFLSSLSLFFPSSFSSPFLIYDCITHTHTHIHICYHLRAIVDHSQLQQLLVIEGSFWSAAFYSVVNIIKHIIFILIFQHLVSHSTLVIIFYVTLKTLYCIAFKF